MHTSSDTFSVGECESSPGGDKSLPIALPPLDGLFFSLPRSLSLSLSLPVATTRFLFYVFRAVQYRTCI